MKYDWREVFIHNLLKLFWIDSTIICEKLHYESKKIRPPIPAEQMGLHDNHNRFSFGQCECKSEKSKQ